MPNLSIKWCQNRHFVKFPKFRLTTEFQTSFSLFSLMAVYWLMSLLLGMIQGGGVFIAGAHSALMVVTPLPAARSRALTISVGIKERH
ncbi:hypothetical protein U14_05237 [Candidatus Moduliflexus flocculans]|uniref:Uncharacterized protein n=1 Tax=Candidatus Moduliflexus flocculans TaxID=1499966 RepID=A0A081BRC9_9BACT|nr:hypothetical protein U14_05237 [Candidatus Moduliflexus flocculans]